MFLKDYGKSMAIGQLTRSSHLTRLSFFFNRHQPVPPHAGRNFVPASAAAPRHPCQLMSQLVLPHIDVVRTRHTHPHSSTQLTPLQHRSTGSLSPHSISKLHACSLLHQAKLVGFLQTRAPPAFCPDLAGSAWLAACPRATASTQRRRS
jgi:hypothetical protein